MPKPSLWSPLDLESLIKYAYLFGSVCPAKGMGEAIVVLGVNKDIMISHLEQISKATEQSRHTVVIMDGASWHCDDIGNEFNNVSIINSPLFSRAEPY
ncbi:hypothetical protein [Vibrio cortegadensis]|uniref:Tc1-like transposase DDE domain-containing protein n=1 Tax=Vibrio cortegadensis TaxID=1328770 RepID=A0ABV4MAW8_9VIBR